MRRALFIFCVAVACGCLVYAGAWFIGGEMQKNEDTRLAQAFHAPVAAGPSADAAPETAAPRDTDQLSATEKYADPLAERFERLAEINPDVIGWITVEGTAIDYPVVRGQDNDHYLTIDFDGGKSKRGSIFSDYRCTKDSPNLIIYGHHMKDGTMFHDLSLFQESEFMEEHPDIRFYLPDGGVTLYRVVDVLYWDTQENHDTTFFETMTSLNYGQGKLISLTTCDNAARNVRIVVVGQGVISE